MSATHCTTELGISVKRKGLDRQVVDGKIDDVDSFALFFLQFFVLCLVVSVNFDHKTGLIRSITSCDGKTLE